MGQIAVQPAVGGVTASCITPAGTSAVHAVSPVTVAAVVATCTISAGITTAAAAGCLGMADRRLQRGEVQGAVLWSGIATGDDESVC